MSTIDLSDLKLTKIKKWNCYKLECMADYIEAHAKTMAGSNSCYIELFAGSGGCICKGTDCRVEGLESRILKAKRKFGKYIFVAKNQQDARGLGQLIEPLQVNNVDIITGNFISGKVIQQLFDSVPRSASIFTLIDPRGYRRLRWATIRKLVAHGGGWKGHKIELLIAFPLEMALLRNLTRRECEASITRLYGNEDWHEIKKGKISGKLKLEEIRQGLVELFKTGLKKLGYKHINDLKPLRFANPPSYHLILATDRDSVTRIFTDVWSKSRYLPCELLYSMKESQNNNSKSKDHTLTS